MKFKKRDNFSLHWCDIQFCFERICCLHTMQVSYEYVLVLYRPSAERTAEEDYEEDIIQPDEITVQNPLSQKAEPVLTPLGKSQHPLLSDITHAHIYTHSHVFIHLYMVLCTVMLTWGYYVEILHHPSSTLLPFLLQACSLLCVKFLVWKTKKKMFPIIFHK